MLRQQFKLTTGRSLPISKRQKWCIRWICSAKNTIYSISWSGLGRRGIMEKWNAATETIRNGSTIIWSSIPMKICWFKWDGIWTAQTEFPCRCWAGDLRLKCDNIWRWLEPRLKWKPPFRYAPLRLPLRIVLIQGHIRTLFSFKSWSHIIDKRTKLA